MLSAQPSGIGQILDQGFALYKRVFTATVPLLIGLQILTSPLSYQMLVANRNMQELLTSPDVEVAMSGIGELYGYIGIILLISLPLYMGLAFRIWKIANGESSSLKDLMVVGLKRFIPFFFGMILFSLGVVFSSIFLLIPGIFLAIAWCLFPIANVVEGAGPIACLGRSYRLVKNNWWRTLAITGVVTIIMIALSGLSFLLVMFDMFGSVESVQDVAKAAANASFISQFFSQIINAIVLPLNFCFYIVLYHDLKLRKEGDDVASRIDDLVAG